MFAFQLSAHLLIFAFPTSWCVPPHTLAAISLALRNQIFMIWSEGCKCKRTGALLRHIYAALAAKKQLPHGFGSSAPTAAVASSVSSLSTSLSSSSSLCARAAAAGGAAAAGVTSAAASGGGTSTPPAATTGLPLITCLGGSIGLGNNDVRIVLLT